ncbi:hypothetical protein [Bradyrhizobium sp.]|uniref:hypothetical protein n=1 Tax=Bradyrhizobium sp. TaxID=376 RepID=UPI0040382572
MIARLRETKETAAIREPSASRKLSGEALMIAEHLEGRMLRRHDRRPLDRRLRNRIIVGNAIAWIVIVVLIRIILS